MMQSNMAISFSFQFFNANMLCGSIQTRNKWSFIKSQWATTRILQSKQIQNLQKNLHKARYIAGVLI